MPSSLETRAVSTAPLRVIHTSAPLSENSVKFYLQKLGFLKQSSNNHGVRTIKILPPVKIRNGEGMQGNTNNARENVDTPKLATEHFNVDSGRKKRKRGKKRKNGIYGSNECYSVTTSSKSKKKKKRKKPLKCLPLDSSSSSSSDEMPISNSGLNPEMPSKKDRYHHPTSSSPSHITLLNTSVVSVEDEDFPKPYQEPKSTPESITSANSIESQFLNSTITITSSSSSGDVVASNLDMRELLSRENFRNGAETSRDSSASTEMLMSAGKACLHNVTTVLSDYFREKIVDCIEVLHVNNFNLRLTVNHLLSCRPEKLMDVSSSASAFTVVNTDSSANVESESEKAAYEICFLKVISVLEDHFGKAGEESLGILRKNNYNILTTIQELQIG